MHRNNKGNMQQIDKPHDSALFNEINKTPPKTLNSTVVAGFDRFCSFSILTVFTVCFMLLSFDFTPKRAVLSADPRVFDVFYFRICCSTLLWFLEIPISCSNPYLFSLLLLVYVVIFVFSSHISQILLKIDLI